jgi:DNA-binding NtrC family response regulator
MPGHRTRPRVVLNPRSEQYKEAPLADCLTGFGAGAVDYISKPFESEEVLIRLKTHLEINRLSQMLAEKNAALEQRTAELEAVNRALQQSNRDLGEAVDRQKQAEEERDHSEERLEQQSERDETWWATGQMCGESETLKSILEEVAQLQTTHSTSVLIVGESGTGKKLVARAIHFGGTRAKGPL